MKFAGVKLHYFRSIGEEPVSLLPWQKCNIVIGQNNSGKSNVIKALQKIAEVLRENTPDMLDELDLHQRSKENVFRFELFFESTNNDNEWIEKLVSLTNISKYNFVLEWRIGSLPQVVDYTLAQLETYDQDNRLFSHLSNKQWNRGVDQETIRSAYLEASNNIFNSHFVQLLPTVHLIPEFRQILPGDTYSLEGNNLIRLLAQYQNPEILRDQQKEKFDQIEGFVRDLLHLPEAKLDVTRDSETLTIENNGLRLPLDSYGTGVHELVILITAVLSLENSICCIEEPEIHLHPKLQRELLSFLTSATSNEYLISSHSPTFINAMEWMDQVGVFHLWQKDFVTVGGSIASDEDALNALSDLGVKASDILQSNCVIWVEGPSDRIYLNQWLELLAPDLIEGQNYSIMFYGGKLLSHISLEREKVPEDLVHVLRINQRAIVIMDSDKSKSRERISETKKRVRTECENSGGICWVTSGREIENYLPETAVVSVCKELTGKQIPLEIHRYHKFDDDLREALTIVDAKQLGYSNEKVRYAKLFAKQFEIDDVKSDLKTQIEIVAEKIRFWNS